MTDALRIVSLILLSIATGGMVRMYLSQSRMPWMAFLALLAATVSMAGNVILKITQYPDTGLRFWITPPVILYSIFIIVALRRFLTIKRVRDEKQN
jgi:hypothetical protein